MIKINKTIFNLQGDKINQNLTLTMPLNSKNSSGNIPPKQRLFGRLVVRDLLTKYVRAYFGKEFCTYKNNSSLMKNTITGSSCQFSASFVENLFKLGILWLKRQKIGQFK